MTRSTLPPDPASLSRLASDAARGAEELRRCAATLATLLADAALPTSALARAEAAHRPRRADRDLAARTSTLVEVSAAVADELLRVAAELQGAATAVAVSRGDLSRVRDEIASHALVLEAGRVLLPWGISGEADSGVARAKEEDRRRLQGQWDAHQRVLDRRRADLVATVEESRRRWVESTERLAR